MKRSIITFVLAIVIVTGLQAQDVKAEPGKQFMQITTIESVVSGGLGRSKMIITNPDGSQKETEMNNLFSIAGINFKNIKENESQVITTLKSYIDEGWKIEQTTSFTLSPGDNGMGIFMTRYLLSRPDTKRGF